MAKRLLLLTNQDRGEANVFLATARALLDQDATLEIHFATFSGLEGDVSSISNRESNHHGSGDANPVVFHQIEGPSMRDCLDIYLEESKTPRDGIGTLPKSFSEPLRFRATLNAIRDATPIYVPFTRHDASLVILSVIDIIERVDADLVVVDTLMTSALTALYHLRVPFLCLSPNSIREFAGTSQPIGHWIRKPALFSGYSHPVPWHLVPANLFFLCYAVYKFSSNSHIRLVEEHMQTKHEMKLRTPLDLFINRPPGLRILVSSLPELDFPLVIPPHVTPCGPILLKSGPIISQDPAMQSWLSKGYTIYVNMGSLYVWDEEGACEFARALAQVLRKTVPQVQVLWKLPMGSSSEKASYSDKVSKLLGEFLRLDRVKIVSWIKADATSLFATGRVLCSVHHGGANSFNEAVCAGVPQVILPQWTDCYDYAQKVQFLGIGRIGNLTAKPRWIANELASEILAIFQGDEAGKIKDAAARLAATCEKHGDGAVNAATIILQQVKGQGRLDPDTFF